VTAAGVTASRATAEPVAAPLSPPLQPVNAVATAVTIADACNALLMSGTKFFMATSNEPKRVLGKAGIAWDERRTAANAIPDGSGAISWPEMLRNCYLGDLMRDSGLRTMRYGASVSGWTEKRRTLPPSLCASLSTETGACVRRRGRASATDGASSVCDGSKCP
jgi:hypothetical protein